jgi:hypothetical protein
MCEPIRKYVEVIGDGESEKFTVTHGLDTMQVMVQLYLTANWEQTHLATITVMTKNEVVIDTSHILYYDPTNANAKERLGYGKGWVTPKDGIKVVVIG